MESIEPKLDIASIGWLVLGGAGLYLAYNAYNDLKSSTADIITDVRGSNVFETSSENTLAEGMRCVNNSQCSSTGVAHGKSVGLDLLGQQDFGCCDGICNKKKKGVLGYKVCDKANVTPPDRIDVALTTYPLGHGCTTTDQCSSNEVRNGPPSDGTNTVCFNNICSRRRIDDNFISLI